MQVDIFITGGSLYSKSKDLPGFEVYGGIGGGYIGYEGGATYYDNAMGGAYINGESVSALEFYNSILLPQSTIPTMDDNLGSGVTVLGIDGLGNQEVLYEDLATGALSVHKIPFWRITGSYYNELYYFSGLVAFDIYAAQASMSSQYVGTGWFSSNSARIGEVNFGTGLVNGVAGFSASHTLSSMTKPDASTNLLKGVKVGAKYVGYGTSSLAFGFGIYNFAVSDKSWGDYGQLSVSLLSSGLSLNAYTAPIGIGIGFIDVAGGFNGFYGYLDTQQQLYNYSGGVMISVQGIPTFIQLRKR